MINYELLGKSVSFYSDEGFKSIEVPWTVTESIARITMPSDVEPIRLVHKDGKVLLGSAEQGFLYLIGKGFLPFGFYQSISPCFRSDSHDESHTKYFMKNELILYGDVVKSNVKSFMVDIAYDFMSMESKVELEIVSTGDNSFDIVTKDGIEIGSYGYRECSFAKWIYGTGLAEPRFSRFCLKD